MKYKMTVKESVKNVAKNTAMILSFALTTGIFSVSEASKLEVPKEIDFKKVMGSFDFSYRSRSSSGKKVDYSVKLYANGLFHFGGVYVGEPALACGAQGGNTVVRLSDEKRADFIIKAIKANNDNQRDKEATNRGGYEEGLQLFVEHAGEMSSANLTNISENVQALRSQVLKEIEENFGDIKNRQYALELKVKEVKEQIVYNLTNIGNKDVVLHFPEKAGSHFFFRNTTSGNLVFLNYQKHMHFKPITLKKKENVQIAFKIPKEAGKNLNYAEGVFIYDNTEKVEHDDPNFINNSPGVHLCNPGNQIK